MNKEQRFTRDHSLFLLFGLFVLAGFTDKKGDPANKRPEHDFYVAGAMRVLGVVELHLSMDEILLGAGIYENVR